MVEYKTAGQEASEEFVERRSRFIGHCRPVSSEEEAVAFINEIKSRHWDANHNVYAYVLRDGQLKRYSDDGEPQGTAGMPVLNVLLHSGVTDTVLVVTRYFGGILLGAGGLVKAYSHGASLALKKAGILTMRQCLLMSVECDYGQYGKLSSLIPECGGFLDGTEFTDRVKISFHMAEDDLHAFEKKLADASAGQCKAEVDGEKFFDCS